MDSASPDSELDDLLTPKPGEPRIDLRDAILRRTSSCIRFRGRMKWAKRMAALAACFLAGMGTIWLFGSDSPPQRVVVVEVPVPVAREETPEPPRLCSARSNWKSRPRRRWCALIRPGNFARQAMVI